MIFQNLAHLRSLLQGVENESGRLAIMQEMFLDRQFSQMAKRSRCALVTECSKGENGHLVAAAVIQHCSVMAEDLNNCTGGEGDHMPPRSQTIGHNNPFFCDGLFEPASLTVRMADRTAMILESIQKKRNF